MPTPPQAILDALNQLQADADALVASTTDAAVKRQTAVNATHAADTADSAVSAGKGQISNDRTALITLINSTFAD